MYYGLIHNFYEHLSGRSVEPYKPTTFFPPFIIHKNCKLCCGPSIFLKQNRNISSVQGKKHPTHHITRSAGQTDFSPKRRSFPHPTSNFKKRLPLPFLSISSNPNCLMPNYNVLYSQILDRWFPP